MPMPPSWMKLKAAVDFFSLFDSNQLKTNAVDFATYCKFLRAGNKGRGNAYFKDANDCFTA